MSKRKQSDTDLAEAPVENVDRAILPASVAKAELSKTASELLEMSRELALATVKRLIDAHQPPGPGEKNHQATALGWPAAIRTPSGCLLAQKKPSHVSLVAFNGHVPWLTLE